jgi:hypothetical protein
MSQLPTTAPDITRDAKQLFLAYKKSAPKASKVKNLEKLWSVLESIREDGGQDYSLAEVGRRLGKIGGPKTQSLRNSQGSQYRDIITAYANAMNGSLKYVSKTKSNVDQAIELITDPSIKAIIKVALEDAKLLKTRNDNLHAAFKSLNIGDLPTRKDVETGKQLNDNPSKSESLKSLTPQFLNALKKGIDASRLAQQELNIAIEGSIENEHGDRIFPAAFAFAIQAIIGTSK